MMRLLPRIALLVGLLCVSACGDSGPPPEGPVVEVKGKLLKGGKGVVIPSNLPPGDKGLIIRFSSPTDSNQVHEAKLLDMSSGTFIVPGFNGKGIKEGPYRIEVQVGPYGKDEFKGKFAGPKSPITRTVKAGQEIIIDLDKPAEQP